VRYADAPLVEDVRRIEPRGVIHCDFRAELSITKRRPVRHFPISDSDDVGQPIATHVSEVHALSSVGKDQRRTLFLLVPRFADELSVTKAIFSQRWVPPEDFVFGDQDVGVAISVEVDEFQVWIAAVKVWKRTEGRERF